MTSHSVQAARFDVPTGVVTLDSGAVVRDGFEAKLSADWEARGFTLGTDSRWVQTPVSGIAEADLVQGGFKGDKALQRAGTGALVLINSTLFGSLATDRIEATFGSKALGARAQLHALCIRPPFQVTDLRLPARSAVATRTGRASSDGWVEYSTGPVDGFGLVALVFESARGLATCE